MDEHISFWDLDGGRVVSVTDAYDPRPPGSSSLFGRWLLVGHMCP